MVASLPESDCILPHAAEEFSQVDGRRLGEIWANCVDSPQDDIIILSLVEHVEADRCGGGPCKLKFPCVHEYNSDFRRLVGFKRDRASSSRRAFS